MLIPLVVNGSKLLKNKGAVLLESVTSPFLANLVVKPTNNDASIFIVLLMFIFIISSITGILKNF